MVRPRRCDGSNKTPIARMRVTPEQMAVIDAHAASKGLKRSAYMLACALTRSAPVLNEAERQLLHSCHGELRRVGINIMSLSRDLGAVALGRKGMETIAVDRLTAIITEVEISVAQFAEARRPIARWLTRRDCKE